MEPTFRGALSRVATRVVGFARFAKPVARVVLAAAGLVLLAFIGRTAIAGAIGRSATVGATSAIAAASAESSNLSNQANVSSPPATPSAAVTAAATATNAASSRARASSEDPVVLNVAVEADLRRLPGIGAKRADAILALRARLGRFRAVEDLLKVKGIGRATLKRLRPLVRIDPPPVDAGLPRPATSSR